MKYQNKIKGDQHNNVINNHVNNNINNINIYSNSTLNPLSKMRENSHNTHTSVGTHDTNVDTILSTRIPSPSAISSPSTIFHHNSTLQLSKRHSKSKTITSVPFRNSIVHDPHKLLTAQASAVSTCVNNTHSGIHNNIHSGKNYNPFSGYYGNSYKRNSNSSNTTHTMSIHEDEEQDMIHHSQPPLLGNNNSNSTKLKFTQSNTSPLPNINNRNGELEGYDETNLNAYGIARSHSSGKLNVYNTHTHTHGHPHGHTHRHGHTHKHHKIPNNNSKYNLNISTSPASLHPSNISPDFQFNNSNANRSISDIDLDLNVPPTYTRTHQQHTHTHIQPVAMAASLFTSSSSNNNNKISKDHFLFMSGMSISFYIYLRE